MTKEIFRRESIKKLKQISRAKAYRYDKKINQQLLYIIKKLKAKSVMLYIPMDIEVDIRPLIKRLRRTKIDIFVPFMEGKSFILVKYRLPLQKKRFGIYEPKISRQYRRRDIDLAVVPIIGIDITFRRVGFGKGMYDRFFEKERRYIKKIIFTQRVLCISPVVVTDRYDVKGDIVITGDNIIKRKY